MQELSGSDVLERCSICLEEEGENIVVLGCGHGFHSSCLKQLRNPACPNCRAPLVGLDDTDVRMMRKRQHDDHREDGINTAVALGLVQRVPFHRRDIICALFEHFPISVIAKCPSAGEFAEAYHNWAHPLLENEPFSCHILRTFAVEVFECVKASSLHQVRALDPRLLSWFCTHVSVSALTTELHEYAHGTFQNAGCTSLHYHALSSARVLLGHALLVSSLTSLSSST